MPVTEINANAIHRYTYEAAGLVHVANYWCMLDSSFEIGVNPLLLAFSSPSFNAYADNVAGYYKVLWDDMYMNTDTLQKHQVFSITSEGLLLVFENSIGQVGALSSGNQDSTPQLTLSFRDASSKKMRTTFFGIVDPVRGRGSSASGKHWANMVDDLKSQTNNKLGQYYQGKSGQAITSFVQWSVQINNRLERKVLWGT